MHFIDFNVSGPNLDIIYLVKYILSHQLLQNMLDVADF